MHLCLHWMVFFIVHDIFDLAGQYTCIHDHAWPWYKCIFLETVFLAPGWSILHCVCAGSLIDLDPGPEKFGKVQPPKSWSGIWTKVRLKFNCGVLQWGKEKHHGVLVHMKDKHHGLMRRRSIAVSWSRWRDRQGAKSREGMRATFPAGEIQLTTWIWTHFYTVSIKQPFNHPTSSFITSGSVSPIHRKLKLPTT